MKRSLPLFFFSLVLGTLLAACGGQEDPAHSHDSGSVEAASPETTENEAVADSSEARIEFERSVYKEYLALIVQIPKKRSDSLVKLASADPKKMKETLEKGMAELRENQEGVARTTLSNKYGMPVDSVGALIDRVAERIKAEQQ